MTIFYDSRTNNVKRFCASLADTKELENLARFINIKDYLENMSDDEKNALSLPYNLITYTTKFGEVPANTSKFLNSINTKKLTSVASSGNRNWGKNYGVAADKIAETFNLPFMKFELSGLSEDVQKYTKMVIDATKFPQQLGHIYP